MTVGESTEGRDHRDGASLKNLTHQRGIGLLSLSDEPEIDLRAVGIVDGG